MVLNNKCIVCGSSNELNTILNVLLDGKKYEVAICDKHSEDTTPRKAKDLVQKKLTEFDALLKQMKDFGIEIPKDQINSNKIVVATKTPEPAPEIEGIEPNEKNEEPEQPAPQKSVTVKKGAPPNKAIPKKIQYQKSDVISAMSDQVKGKSGTVTDEKRGGSVTIEDRSAIDVASAVTEGIGKLKERGLIKKDQDVSIPVPVKVESQMAPGRKGMPVRIPKVIRDNNGGVTTIAIVNTGGDQAIQERFKDMAEESKRTEGNNAYSYGEKGYDVMNCSLCEGTGKTRATGDTCPKCKGVGVLNRGRR